MTRVRGWQLVCLSYSVLLLGHHSWIINRSHLWLERGCLFVCVVLILHLFALLFLQLILLLFVLLLLLPLLFLSGRSLIKLASIHDKRESVIVIDIDIVLLLFQQKIINRTGFHSWQGERRGESVCFASYRDPALSHLTVTMYTEGERVKNPKSKIKMKNIKVQ